MHFDRSALRCRPRLGEADFLYAFAADELAERLTYTTRRFDRALYTGPMTPRVHAALARGVPQLTAQSPEAGADVDVRADVSVPFSRAFPLALSLNDLHVANDPVSALGEIRGALLPDGLFLGAAPCSGTLHELIDALVHAESQISGGAALRVAPFANVRRWGDALARAGFALPVADEVRLTVRYERLASLFLDLRAMGMRRVLDQRTPAPRRLFEAAEAYYKANHTEPDGKLRATFVFAFLSGWAPDRSQQQPARRGSATVRLEDVLKAAEGEADGTTGTGGRGGAD